MHFFCNCLIFSNHYFCNFGEFSYLMRSKGSKKPLSVERSLTHVCIYNERACVYACARYSAFGAFAFEAFGALGAGASGAGSAAGSGAGAGSSTGSSTV